MRIEAHLSSLDFRQIEDIVEDREQSFGRILDGAQHLALFLLQTFRVQRFRQSEDAVQRSPQFMAHDRQKCRLGVAGRVCGPHCIAQLGHIVLADHEDLIARQGMPAHANVERMPTDPVQPVHPALEPAASAAADDAFQDPLPLFGVFKAADEHRRARCPVAPHGSAVSFCCSRILANRSPVQEITGDTNVGVAHRFDEEQMLGLIADIDIFEHDPHHRPMSLGPTRTARCLIRTVFGWPLG